MGKNRGVGGFVDKLVLRKGNEEIEVLTKVIEDAEKLRPLASKDCWKVFRKLHEKPSYPAMLAKELSMNEQKVYYCVKQFKNAGLIELERTEERNGAVAKYYSAAFDSFSLVASRDSLGKKSRVIRNSGETGRPAFEFLSDFTKKGVFLAKIIVGSPDPHGPAKARARDGHLSAELAAFIGANCSGFEFPLVFLDTMVKDLKNENSSLIILGGPVTNRLCEQVNEFLPVKFSAQSGNWSVSSSVSGKNYADDTIGVVEKMPHPYFRGKWILVVAGKRNAGTISALLALTKKTRQTVMPNSYDKNVSARVVEGLDVDGDGMIDDVEFRE